MKKRKVLYISAMFDYGTYQQLFTQEKKPMHAANKFHTLLVRGLAEHGVQVTAYSTLPVSRTNCRKKYIRISPQKEKNLTRQYISVFNFPGIRHAQLFWKSFWKALFSSSQTVVVYDALVVSSALGAVYGAKLSRKKSYAVVTDLPQFMPIAQNQRLLKINQRLLRSADGYVFLTKQMNDAVNPRHKPYVIVEGMVDECMSEMPHKSFSNEQKRVVYAGSLQKKYGIARLCEAFVACRVPNAELHIYGDGDYTTELVELARLHPSIVYHGNVLNHVVVEAESEAFLLVNPRPSEGEYTKYSFPSKTLEYMVSGTPVLTARLPGIPEEYQEYLLFFEETDGGLTGALKKALETDPSDMKHLGDRAREFALSRKNNISQTGQIVRLIDG